MLSVVVVLYLDNVEGRHEDGLFKKKIKNQQIVFMSSVRAADLFLQTAQIFTTPANT